MKEREFEGKAADSLENKSLRYPLCKHAGRQGSAAADSRRHGLMWILMTACSSKPGAKQRAGRGWPAVVIFLLIHALPSRAQQPHP
jgi:hypothetical protein